MDAVFGSFPDAQPQDTELKDEPGWAGAVEYAATGRRQATEAPKWFDVHRRLEPETAGYTWWTFRGQAFNNDAGWRIDLQAATANMLERAERVWVDRAPSVETRWSDHSPVVVEYR